jgi:hypothetical protein
MMRTRDETRQAASERGFPLVFSDELRDQFDCDGALLTVDYKARRCHPQGVGYRAHGRAGHRRNQQEAQGAVLHTQRLHPVIRWG